jgi:hypothetical protein
MSKWAVAIGFSIKNPKLGVTEAQFFKNWRWKKNWGWKQWSISSMHPKIGYSHTRAVWVCASCIVYIKLLRHEEIKTISGGLNQLVLARRPTGWITLRILCKLISICIHGHHNCHTWLNPHAWFISLCFCTNFDYKLDEKRTWVE